MKVIGALTTLTVLALATGLQAAEPAFEVHLHDGGRVFTWSPSPRLDARVVERLPAYRDSACRALVNLLEEPALRTLLLDLLRSGPHATVHLDLTLDDPPGDGALWPAAEVDERAAIVAGEQGLRRACRNVDDTRALLLHEAAHLVDPTLVLAGEDVSYGPFDVLEPHLAFGEGWGCFWGGEVPGLSRVFRARIFRRLRRTGPDGVRSWTETPSRDDYLAHPITVAGILHDLTLLPGGRPALVAAVHDAWRLEAPTAHDVIACYLRASPDAGSAVAAVVDRRTRARRAP